MSSYSISATGKTRFRRISSRRAWALTLPSTGCAPPVPDVPTKCGAPLRGIVFGRFAAFAAGMSTLSSMLNSMGTVTLVDVWKLHFPGKASEQIWIRRARLLTLVWGGFSFVSALFVLQFGTVITAGIRLGSVITGGLFGMFLLGIFVRRAGAVSAVVGSVCGMTTVVFVMAMSEISWSWYCGIGTVVTFLTGYVSSVLAPATAGPQELLYSSLGRSTGLEPLP